MTKLTPIHPGEILLEDFMKPLDLSQNELARAIGVPPRRINEIVHGQRAISADTALRLALCFGTSPQVWIGLQSEYDLRMAERAPKWRKLKVTKLVTYSRGKTRWLSRESRTKKVA